MPCFKDALGNIIELQEPPKKIISVVPSQTELLYHLGLENEVLGITKFCIHPNAWFRNKIRVGGTKNLNLQKIIALNPDLIIANKEENEQSQIEKLSTLFPVYTTDIFHLNDAIDMINHVGALCNKPSEALLLSNEILEAFKKLRPISPPKTCLYLIWKDPYMVSGTDTFINDMLIRCGFHNLANGRYPAYTLDEIAYLHPDILLLSSEPYPFKAKHITILKEKLPNTEIFLVDGEYFSWYGSRLIGAPNYFNSFIHHINKR